MGAASCSSLKVVLPLDTDFEPFGVDAIVSMVSASDPKTSDKLLCCSVRDGSNTVVLAIFLCLVKLSGLGECTRSTNNSVSSSLEDSVGCTDASGVMRRAGDGVFG